MSSTGRLKKAYYSTLTSILYQCASLGCGFILPRLILSHYGSSYNGAVSSITQFFNVFSIFTTGIQGSTRVVLYNALGKNDHQNVSAIMKANIEYYRKLSFLLIGYIAVLAVVFPLMLKNDNIVDLDIVLLVLIIGLSSFVQYYFGNAYKALLIADQSTYILNILQTATVILSTVISAIIMFLNGSLVIVKFGSGIAYALNPIVLYIYVCKHYRLNRKIKGDKSALKGRWDVLANSFANIVHENVDIFFITFFCATREISVYTVYNLVSNGLIRLMQVFIDGIESAFGNMWAKNETSIIQLNFKKYEYVMFSVADIITSCMYVLIIPFIRVYTKNISDANYIRPVFALLLTIALMTMCIRTPYVMLVQAVGHYKQTKKGSFIEAFINIVLTFCLIPCFGIEGAIIGTIIANTFRTVQYGYYASKHILHRSYYHFILRSIWLIFTVITSILISSLICNKLKTSNLLEWIILAVICFLIHLCVLLISSLIFYKDDIKNLWVVILKLLDIKMK